jgi:DNA-binding transcriptional MerR regulator
MKQICGHRFYTSDETAKILGITPRTLQKWLNDDSPARSRMKSFDLQPVTELNGRRLFKTEEVHRLVEQIYGIQVDPKEVKRILKPVGA